MGPEIYESKNAGSVYTELSARADNGNPGKSPTVKLMTPKNLRLLLAVLLFLALGGQCLAAPPGAIWNHWTYDVMSVAQCERWSNRALEAEGFSVVPNLHGVAWGTIGPHSALVQCWAAPNLTIVIATNGDQGEAARLRDQLERRIHERSLHHERERDDDR